MPRWKNAAPIKLFVIADNETGDSVVFKTARERTAYMVKNHPIFPVARFKYMTYIQAPKKEKS